MNGTTRSILLSLLLGAVLCTGAIAGPVWTCSITTVVAVDEDGTVGPPDTGRQERPTFFRVDVDKKEITLLAPKSRAGEVTKIDSVREGKDHWLFSGVEANRAWSLMISAEGRVTLSISTDGAVWSVFGTALEQK